MKSVLLQAGHEGTVRNSGSGTAPSYGAGGIARPEREMTPIVRTWAAKLLRDTGLFEVIEEDAFYDQVYEVDLAVSLHFDGSGTPCASGASIGYPAGDPPGSNRPAADLWRAIYDDIWPFRWKKDNFTDNLRYYYGYRWTSTSDAEMLIEFGEISCPEQDAWLQPRVGDGEGMPSYLGHLVAFFVAERLEPGVEHGIEHPGMYEEWIKPPEDRREVVDILHNALVSNERAKRDVFDAQQLLSDALERIHRTEMRINRALRSLES